MPDPQDPTTFTNSKLDWADVSSERGAAILRAYRVLIALRRTDQAFVDHRYEANAVRFSEDRRWLVLTRGLLGPDVAPVHVVVNLADDAAEVPVPDAVGEEPLRLRRDRGGCRRRPVPRPRRGRAALATRELR